MAAPPDTPPSRPGPAMGRCARGLLWGLGVVGHRRRSCGRGASPQNGSRGRRRPIASARPRPGSRSPPPTPVPIHTLNRWGVRQGPLRPAALGPPLPRHPFLARRAEGSAAVAALRSSRRTTATTRPSANCGTGRCAHRWPPPTSPFLNRKPHPYPTRLYQFSHWDGAGGAEEGSQGGCQWRCGPWLGTGGHRLGGRRGCPARPAHSRGGTKWGPSSWGTRSRRP